MEYESYEELLERRQKSKKNYEKVLNKIYEKGVDATIKNIFTTFSKKNNKEEKTKKIQKSLLKVKSKYHLFVRIIKACR